MEPSFRFAEFHEDEPKAVQPPAPQLYITRNQLILHDCMFLLLLMFLVRVAPTHRIEYSICFPSRKRLFLQHYLAYGWVNQGGDKKA